MFTYEFIAKFVDRCLWYSCKFPQSAEIYKHQAFGALQFAIEAQPQLESALVQMWDTVWKPLFEYPIDED